MTAPIHAQSTILPEFNRQCVPDADLFASCDQAEYHHGAGVYHYVYDNDLVISVTADNQYLLVIGNDIAYHATLEAAEHALRAWAVTERGLTAPLSALTAELVRSDTAVIAYFKELIALDALYHLDDDTTDIPFDNLNDTDRNTLRLNQDILSGSGDQDRLWNLLYSRKCSACNGDTMLDNPLCSDCS